MRFGVARLRMGHPLMCMQGTPADGRTPRPEIRRGAFDWLEVSGSTSVRPRFPGFRHCVGVGMGPPPSSPAKMPRVSTAASAAPPTISPATR